RLGRQIGIDAEVDAGHLAHRLGDLCQRQQLAFALDVEDQDTGLEAVAQLGIGFADAGEDDLRSGAAGLERAIQLAGAGDVEAGAVFSHQPADVDVRVRLDAVANQGSYVDICRL